jgi:hypothetical protein
MTHKHIALVAVSTILIAGALTGCGSSSSSSPATQSATSAASATPSSGGSGGGANAAALQTDKAMVAKYSTAQPPITVPALPQKAPTGKTLALVTCPLPACSSVTTASAAAAKTLGWKVDTFNSQLTPQGYQAAWQEAVQAHPTALSVVAVTPDATVSKYVDEVAKAGIPWNEIAPAGDRPSANGPLKASYNGYPEFLESGQLMGDVVAAASNGTAQAVVVEDPSLSPILGPVVDGFTTQLKAAGGSVTELPVSAANTGKTIPGQVVSFLQSHPSMKYVAFELSDLDAGVAPAIKAAGLSGIRIVSRAPQASNLAAVKDGTEFAEVGEEDICNGYRAVDGLLRDMEGVPLGTFATEPTGWHEIFTAADVTETTSAPQTPGCPSAFLKAWHAG